MTNREFETRTKRFALRCLNATNALPKASSGRAIRSQLARSRTSVGANYRAANRARSTAEWFSKICIVVEECDETAYWLELIMEAELLAPQKITPLHKEAGEEAGELLAIFAAARKTAKSRSAALKSPTHQIAKSMTLIGIGYDVHRFAEGRKLILGGVTIPHDRGLDGHSDADVLCHAIADAILGAIGERDIGHHFPNTDPKCAGMSSLQILHRAVELVKSVDGHVVNVDATLIAEVPKISPYIEAMKINIGRELGLPLRRVGIKGTTNESLGFIGRAEGIAVMAIANVELPE